MDSYKPKRIEITKNHEGGYSLSFSLATESYANEAGIFRDFYLSLGLIFCNFTIVFLRLGESNTK